MVFREHTATVEGPISIGNDLVDTSDTTGIILTWRPAPIQVYDKLCISGRTQLTALYNYDDLRFVVSAHGGLLLLISH